jgi:hypothetical protein
MLWFWSSFKPYFSFIIIQRFFITSATGAITTKAAKATKTRKTIRA